ncbi:helix-turn-helix domain-containing protein [uncultured Aliiroseovarius sp.]|uniref:helix-turn-helix domain-containing protein n=1 Tax=uncultured Aliiroseovarius sp. TaxID=1658783 RepID=UPI002594DFDA|nr:helix-turn-helix domain-containing protein [uncultured Aliiroseovarius sp.]
MRDSDIMEIRQLSLFDGISDTYFDKLTHGAYVQSFPPQVELINEGDFCDFLHIIVEGRVELFAHWNERESTMAILRPVSTFILAATIRDAPCLMSARTLEKTRIVLLPSSNVRAVFSEDTAFARAVVEDLAKSYRSVIRSSKDLKLRSAIERLANYLLRQRKRAGDAVEFTLPIEKRRLASNLGMTAENLSRAFKTLQPYGVETDGATVTIRDPADLIKLAKPTPLID